MKIVFNRQAVLAATAPLMCATGNRSAHPAVEGIRIEAKSPDLCTLTTYDLEKGVQITIEAKVMEEGCFIINAQKFNQTMRVMDGDEVSLTVDRNLTAVIESGKSSHKMIALAGNDFPELPYLTSERGFGITAGVLRDMLSKTMYAMGVNDQRSVLNGTYFAPDASSNMAAPTPIKAPTAMQITRKIRTHVLNSLRSWFTKECHA